MIRSLIGKAAVASFALVAATSVAQAQTGTVSFTGGAQVTSTNDAGAPLPGGCCVLLDFLTGVNTPGTPTGTWTVEGTSTGFFSTLTAGTTGTVSDLNIGSSDVNLFGDTFLQIGGYTFSNPMFIMSGPTVPGSIAAGEILLEPYALGTRATLGVRGTVTGNGIVGGSFIGILTTQFTSLPGLNGGQATLAPTPEQLYAFVNAGNVLSTGVSSTFSATIVPEPSTYALMGLGLAGMAVFARRRRLV